MSIAVVWDNDEQTVVRMDFAYGWDFAQFRAAIDDATDMMRARQGAVIGVIVDISRDRIPPPGASLHFKNAVDGGSHLPPVVFVRKEYVTYKLFQMLKKTYDIQREIEFVDTLADARDWLQEHHAQREQLSLTSDDTHR